jgi:hypothetical protein
MWPQRVERHHGDEALTVLASHWQACAKAAWSDSPETEEQRRYVREWSKRQAERLLRTAS